jgi:hypothetical protein
LPAVGGGTFPVAALDMVPPTVAEHITFAY